MKSSLLALMTLSVFLSCQVQRPIPVAASVATMAPEILFLQVHIWKNDAGYRAEVRQQRRVAGQLLHDLQDAPRLKGQWLISLLDAEDQLITQITLANPLQERYETEGIDGQLRTVEINKEEADCFIRVQYDRRFARLRIGEIANSTTSNPIIYLHL